jgi:hypothetical protein
MTDEQMDSRLQRAGAAWRSGQPTTHVLESPAPPFDLSTVALHRRVPRLGLLVSAAAVAAALIVGTVVLTTSLGSNRPEPAMSTELSQLINRTWHLLSVGGHPSKEDITLRIDLTQRVDGHMSGLDGCHTISTFPNLHDGWWKPNGPITPEAVGNCRSPIHRILAAARVRWSVADGKLTVRAGGPPTTALVYGRAAPSGVTPRLAGLTWTLSTWDSSAPNTPDVNGSYPERTELRFDGADGLTITHRCYVNSAHVTFGSAALDITGVTLRSSTPCPGRTGQRQEQQVDQFLDQTLSGPVRWSVTDGELHIAHGTTSIDFSR